MEEIYTLSEMERLNDETFSRLSYLNYIFNFTEIGSNISKSLDEIVAPDLVYKGGFALVRSLSADVKFDIFVKMGVDPLEAQKRANTFDVMDTFNCSRPVAKLLAECIAAGWRSALSLNDNSSGNAVFIWDDFSDDEVVLSMHIDL